MSDFRIGDKKFFCERIDATLDVSSSRRRSTRNQVSEVSLLFDENTNPFEFRVSLCKKALVSQSDDSSVNRSITVRMIAHGLTDNISDLLESPVIHLKKRVNDTPLNRLQAVLQIRNSPVTDNIRSVFNKVLVE